MLLRRLACWLGLALALFAPFGCTTCNQTAGYDCLKSIESVSALAPQRAKVYVFLMNGADLFDLGGLKELEGKLNAAGFPKIYYAQRFDRDWYYREIHRLRRDDPENRFVLIGQGTAADQLQKLARCLSHDEIPLDAVVFLDPVGAKFDAETPYPAKVIRSHQVIGAPLASGQHETMILQNVGHLHLSDHPATVSALVELLFASAQRVNIPRPRVECVPLTEEPKPIPRPSEPKVVPAVPPGWTVLCPESGR